MSKSQKPRKQCSPVSNTEKIPGTFQNPQQPPLGWKGGLAKFTLCTFFFLGKGRLPFNVGEGRKKNLGVLGNWYGESMVLGGRRGGLRVFVGFFSFSPHLFSPLFFSLTSILSNSSLLITFPFKAPFPHTRFQSSLYPLLFGLLSNHSISFSVGKGKLKPSFFDENQNSSSWGKEKARWEHLFLSFFLFLFSSTPSPKSQKNKNAPPWFPHHSPQKSRKQNAKLQTMKRFSNFPHKRNPPPHRASLHIKSPQKNQFDLLDFFLVCFS